MRRHIGRRAIKQRRGATIVFVALFAVAIVGLAAFAIDVSRLYVGVNELQTGADASALRGARFLQLNRDQSPVAAIASFDDRNQALDAPIDVSFSGVRPVFWDPAGSPQATYLNSWTNANAVEVTADRMTGLLFGRALSAVNSTPRRRAIAWIANITAVDCPTPWGFPMLALNEHLYGSTSPNTVNANIFDDLTRRLGEVNGPQSMTMIFWPPTHLDNSGPKLPKQDGTDSAFYALAANMNDYADQLASPTSQCGNQTISIGTAEQFPGAGSGSTAQKTVDGTEAVRTANKLVGLCESQGLPANRADCWPIGSLSFSGQTPGVTVTVGWVGSVSGSSVPVVTIGGFKVMCVYRDPGKGKGGNESCEWLDGSANKAYFNAAGVKSPYDLGTVVGYPVPTYPGLGGGTQIGNAPSLAQRLILVR